MAVHDWSNLSNVEKLVYLQQVIKDGSTRSAVGGLSSYGDRPHVATN